jgi:DNA repair exonuclease SbcCD ATPase subunit
MPMSASCLLNRASTLTAIDAIKAALPDRLAAADALLATREEVLAQAHEQAEEVLAEATDEAQRRLSMTSVGAEAGAWADALRKAAEAEVAAAREQADLDADAKLAHVEVILERTLSLARHANEDPASSAAEASRQLGDLVATLEQMLDGVRRGRENMHGRHHMEDLGDHLRVAEAGGDAPEQHGLGPLDDLG